MGIKQQIEVAKSSLKIMALESKARAYASGNTLGDRAMHPATLRKCERAAAKRRAELEK